MTTLDTPYRPPARPRGAELMLDRNEGPAPSPALLDRLAALSPEALRRYPSAATLESACAGRLGVAPERVLATAGGDDALDRLCVAFLQPRDAVVLPVPTFEMIERSVLRRGAEVRRVAWDGAFPADAVLGALDDQVRLVFIVSPNNPTGAIASAETIERIAVAAPQAIVVLDAAYVEFAACDPTERVLQRPNVAVVRTMSKAYGLAGLRVGFALAAPDVIERLRAAGSPYAVSGPAASIAQAALEAGPDGASLQRIAVERERLADALRAIGARADAGEANFVLGRLDGAGKLAKALGRRGIAVRTFPGVPGLADAVRITCPGGEGDFDRLLVALREAAVEVSKDQGRDQGSATEEWA